MNRQDIKNAASKLTMSFQKNGYIPEIIHEYTDFDGRPIYWKLRQRHKITGEKQIFPMCSINNEMVLREPAFEGKKPLYKLHTLKMAEKIFFVEGEACADALCNIGIIATTGGGATSHSKLDFEPLRNKVVYAWADNDLPGIKHIHEVAKKLVSVNAKVYIIDTESLGLDSGGDVVDWLKIHPDATQHQIENLNANEFNVPKELDLSPKKTKGRIDHLSTARAAIEELGPENIFFSLGTLWHWKGDGVWHQIDDRDIKKVVHRLAEAEQLTASIVNSVVDMVKTETTKVNVPFDNNPKVINCLNGEISYVNNEWLLTPHNREHFRTSMVPVAYNPTAEAPRFTQFLEEVFRGDDDCLQKMLVVQEAMGYTLIPSCHLEKFMMLIGGGANGKSVLLGILEQLLGEKNVSAVQPEQFGNRFQRGHLFKKLANIVTEIKEGGEIADAQLKSLTSGELTTAENKFAPPFDFKPYATHWFGTNHLPHTRDFSNALFRRGIILTFNNKFEGSAQDVRLSEKLKLELSGIFNHALAGLARLNENLRFTECKSSIEALNLWRLEADQAAQFVEECCEEVSGVCTASSELYQEYSKWAETVGIRQKLNRKNFSTRLDRLGYKLDRKGSGGKRVISGLIISTGVNQSSYSSMRGAI